MSRVARIENALLNLLYFKGTDLRWRPYGRNYLVCNGCASGRADDANGVIVQINPCNSDCPWKEAEEALK